MATHPPVTREDLYARVWAKPVREVACDLHVSDVGLAKVCRRLNVPLPPRGHWAKLAAGQTVVTPPLPAPASGQELEWVRERWRQPRRAPLLLTNRPTALSTAASVRRRPARHPLLENIIHYYDKLRTDSLYLIPTKRHLVDVFVSKAQLTRALTLANVLYTACELQGYPVIISVDRALHRPGLNQQEVPTDSSWQYGIGSWSPNAPTIVRIGDIAIALTVYELSEEVSGRYIGSEWTRIGQEPPRMPRSRVQYSDFVSKRTLPSGRLAIRAASPYRGVTWTQDWRETTGETLVDRIEEVVKACEQAAPILVQRVNEAEVLQQARRVEAERRQREYEEQQREQQCVAAANASRKELGDLAEAWAGRCRIETFFADALQDAERLSVAERVAVAERIRRARALLNPQTPAIRILEWTLPEDRVPLNLRDRFAKLAFPVAAEEPSRVVAKQSSPPVPNEPPKSYWESRHWWQR